MIAAMMVTAPMLPVSGEVENASPPNQLLELRTYHAALGKLDALLTRSRDHTLTLFEMHGMTNVGYWRSVDNKDNLLVFLLADPDKEVHATP